MKQIIYKCETCEKERDNRLPESWMEIDGGEIGLKITSGLEGARLKELDLHNSIHFCCRKCFINFFFKES